MDSYTITIAPNDDSGAATRLVVETSGDQVRITDVHLHAPQGLSSGYIPSLDVDLLLRAVTGTAGGAGGQHVVAGPTQLSTPQHSTPAIEAAKATEPADQTAAPAAPSRRTRKAAARAQAAPLPRPGRPRTAKAASADEAVAPRRVARGAAKSTTRAAKQAPAKAAKQATGKATTSTPASARKRTVARAAAPAKSQAPAKRTRAATTKASPATSGRVYRRTPGDLAAVFAQVGTVAGIAEHYQVPRYTAQGWVSRLRATA